MGRASDREDAGSVDDESDVRSPSLLDALLVYAEPLAEGAEIIVVGDASLGLAERLVDLGARAVVVLDPESTRAHRFSALLRGERRISVRALGDTDVATLGAADLVIAPDLALLASSLPDLRARIGRLRRAVVPSGAFVAMARAEMEADDDEAFADEIGPAVVGYAELYELFAIDFDNVAMTGVLPFRGVVFAELGADAGDESPAVSVDTRLATGAAPSVFVVVASQAPVGLDPYAIVQVPEGDDLSAHEDVAIASLADAAVRGETLASEVETLAARLRVSELRAAESVGHLERARFEREAALTRAAELELVLAAAQQSIANLERRLVASEQGLLERDDQLAAQSAAMAVALSRLEDEIRAREADDARARERAVDPALVEALTVRAERAESALALNVADLAHVGDSHAKDTALLEGQLRERAHVIADLEKEIVRREQLVRELVTSLEDAREGATAAMPSFEAAPPLPPASSRELVHARHELGQMRDARDAARDEAHAFRGKLDALADEVARREGELVAQAWRISELENERIRLLARAQGAARRSVAQDRSDEHVSAMPPSPAPSGAHSELLRDELSRVRDERDALRQALVKEHAARVSAESGEELAHARAELARQSALLEQMRAR